MKTIFKKKEQGFTIIEIAFVLGIFAILASITLFKFRDFNSRIAFNNITQDIALQIVRAQKAAINGMSDVGQTIYTGVTPVYGLFVTTCGSNNNNRELVFWTDLNPSTTNPPIYDYALTCPVGVPGAEFISKSVMPADTLISVICLGSDPSCGQYLPQAQAFVSFKRPYPDAKLVWRSTPAGTIVSTGISGVCIEIAGGNNYSLRKTIVITPIGKVLVLDGQAMNTCISNNFI